jgi:hypothetical protein
MHSALGFEYAWHSHIRSRLRGAKAAFGHSEPLPRHYHDTHVKHSRDEQEFGSERVSVCVVVVRSLCYSITVCLRQGVYGVLGQDSAAWPPRLDLWRDYKIIP